jgi:hypothetical protein
MLKKYFINGQEVFRGQKVIGYDPNLPLDAQSERTCWVDWLSDDLSAYGVTSTEVPEAVSVEVVRSEKISQLSQLWDSHPGIEVAPGVVLPIENAKVAINGSSFVLSMQTGQDINLVDINDWTVTLPLESAKSSLGVFQTKYSAISAKYDSVRKSLEQATTIDQLGSIDITLE